MKLQSGYNANRQGTKDINPQIKSLVCDDKNKACMYRECALCLQKEISWNFAAHEGEHVKWTAWEKNKRIEKGKDADGQPKVVSMAVEQVDHGTK